MAERQKMEQKRAKEESVMTQYEFNWEVTDDELDTWKYCTRGQSFESKEFSFYGQTWSLQCHPNQNKKKKVLSIALNRKSGANDVSLDVYGFVLSIISNETCLGEKKRTVVMKGNDTYWGPMDIDISTYWGDTDQITIRFVFNAFGQRELNEFEWISSFLDDSDSASFNCDATGESQWYLRMRKRNEYLHIGLRCQATNSAFAVIYTIELVNGTAKFQRAYLYDDYGEDEGKLCLMDEIQDLETLHLKCRIRIIESDDATKVLPNGGLNWEVSGDLLEQLKTAELGDSFFSPKFESDDASWYLRIEQNENRAKQNLVTFSFISASPERFCYCAHECIWYKPACSEMDQLRISYDADDSSCTGTAIWDYSSSNELKKMNIQCEIQSNCRLWEMKRSELCDNKFEFELHDLKWELKTNSDTINLTLVQLPPLISKVKAFLTIVIDQCSVDQTVYVEFTKQNTTSTMRDILGLLNDDDDDNDDDDSDSDDDDDDDDDDD
eukprot:369844_1